MNFIFQNKRYLFLNNISNISSLRNIFLGCGFIQSILFIFPFILPFINLNKQIY